MKNTVRSILLLIVIGGSYAMIVPAPVQASPTASNAYIMRWYRQRARMQSNSRMKGKADYLDRPKRGTTEQRLKIKVEKAMPNTEYNVLFNDGKIGVIMTNSLGRGKLKLRTPEFIHTDRWLPIPNNFPRVIDGDQIEVGPASGTFHLR